MVLKSARGCTGAIVIAAALGWSGPTWAVPAPDSVTILRVQGACDSAARLRVTTSSHVYESDRLRIEEAGVLLPPPPGRPALVTLGDPVLPVRRFSWNEIESLDSERSRILRDTAIGGAVGAALAGLSFARTGPDLFEGGDSGGFGLAMLVFVGVTGIGMLHGMTHPDLQRIYP